jgi:hypothetical protein
MRRFYSMVLKPDLALITQQLRQEVMNMKRTLTAALAALMLAGVLSAVGGMTPVCATTPVNLIGEGTAPLPIALPSSDLKSDSSSLNPKF